MIWKVPILEEKNVKHECPPLNVTISAGHTKMYKQDCKILYQLATDLYDLSVI